MEVFLISHFFEDRVIAIFLVTGASFFLLDAAVLWKSRSYSPSHMRLFLWGWNAAAVLGIFWNALHGSLLLAQAHSFHL
jgi:hypothetical protein